jgi:hypothetical protein
MNQKNLNCAKFLAVLNTIFIHSLKVKWFYTGLRAPGSQVFRQSAHEGGKVVSPTHRPPLTPKEGFLVLISVRG